ncbi:MAG: hypothetical protein ACXW5U_14255 [Thermoanaerobaculia bacterium]
MKRALTVGLYVGFALAVFGIVRWMSLYETPSHQQRTYEDYAEECQSEGCDGEEVRELYVSYQEECLSEGCDIEEVIELAGNSGAVNAMVNDFQSRGWTVTPCSFIPPQVPAGLPNGATGDLDFVGGWCNQASIDTFWNDFDFDHDNWDQGFGFDAACDVNLPLARTFNAIALLRLFGTSKPADSNNWLPWFYGFAKDSIDELDGECGNGRTSGTLAYTTWGWQDNYTELYWGFFYGQDVPSRAGSLVHEARHADSWEGHDGSSCTAGSCDISWGSNRARRFEVLYVWWLRFAGGGSITTNTSNLAQARANTVLVTAFDNRPTRGEVFGSSVSSPSAFLSIP